MLLAVVLCLAELAPRTDVDTTLDTFDRLRLAASTSPAAANAPEQPRPAPERTPVPDLGGKRSEQPSAVKDIATRSAHDRAVRQFLLDLRKIRDEIVLIDEFAYDYGRRMFPDYAELACSADDLPKWTDVETLLSFSPSSNGVHWRQRWDKLCKDEVDLRHQA